MVEATISAGENQDATPEAGKETITSEKLKEAAVPSSEAEKKVAELQGQVEALNRQAKQYQDLQRQADKKARVEKIERQKLEKILETIRSGESYVPPEIPEGETPTEREVRLEAKIGIQNLILESSEYQELIKQDITLREVLKNNPFALIGDYFDAQDAVEQIKEKLEQRVSSLKVQPKEEKKGEGAEFEVGPTQLKDDGTQLPPKQQTPQTLDEKLEQGLMSKIRVV